MNPKRIVRKKGMTEESAVRECLLNNPQTAFDGTLHISDVFQYTTRRMYDTPVVEHIYEAIVLHGPFGEGQVGWLDAATRGELP